VVHGTTVGTNALYKDVARAPPSDHRGFEDVLAIAARRGPNFTISMLRSRRRWCLTIFVWVCLSGSPPPVKSSRPWTKMNREARQDTQKSAR